jgi:DNA-binding transcriptional MerR regulator
MARRPLRTINVRIGSRDYEKPFDPACPACQSPWMLQIDHWLAAGYSVQDIGEQLKARRAPKLSAQQLKAHVPHLAGPHRVDRERFARGGEPDGSSLTDVAANIVRRGFEDMVSGSPAMELNGRDLIRAVKLMSDLEARGREDGGSADEWRAAFTEFFEIARQHVPADAWAAFLADIYSSQSIATVTGRPSSPAILEASAQGPAEASGAEIASTR